MNYSLINVYNLIYRIRNPWGNDVEWKGAWYELRFEISNKTK